MFPTKNNSQNKSIWKIFKNDICKNEKLKKFTENILEFFPYFFLCKILIEFKAHSNDAENLSDNAMLD